MKRYIDINEISDGKKYRRNDMVKLGCQECAGCSACCHNMESTVLDPWDIYMLTTHLDCTFEALLGKYLELRVIDGAILPHLRMDGENNGCLFLNEQGRCQIHGFRPGICRLFPLGRIYEEDTFFYFLQIHECKKQQRTKEKIEKWLGISQLSKYESYIFQWHQLLKRFQERFFALNAEQQKQWNMLLLQVFFLKPYEKEDFYIQFENRCVMLEGIL